MQRSRRVRSYLDPDVESFLEDAAETTRGPTQVHRELGQYLEQMKKSAMLPSLRTVQARLKEYRALHDPTAPWTLGQAEPNTIDLILPILEVVLERTEGERQYITNGEARYIERIRRVGPTLDPWVTYRFARLYLRRDLLKVGTSDLDAFLAFMPWTSAEQAKRYHRAVFDGWMPMAPSFLLETVPPEWRRVVTESDPPMGEDREFESAMRSQKFFRRPETRKIMRKAYQEHENG